MEMLHIKTGSKYPKALPFEANDRSVTPKDRLTTPSENDKSFAKSTAKFVTRRTGHCRAQTLLHAVQAFSYLLIKRRATSGSGHAHSQPVSFKEHDNNNHY
jgi:hypothetical protein